MPEAADAPIFEAVIVPHRSLSRRGRRRLLGAIGLMCAVNAAIFIYIGAWPVGGFTGIELFLAAVLLQVNAHGARASEVLVLTSAGMSITRTDRHGARDERLLPAAWLRVTLDEPPGRVPRLFLGVRAMREEIAASLGEAEKRDLFATLSAAMLRWRSPVFDNPQLRGEAPHQGAADQGSLDPSDFIRS